MSTLRACLRLAAIAALTLGSFGIWLAGRAVLGRDSPRARRWRRAWMRAWSHGVVRVLGARVELEGRVPDAPCVLVSNHMGYVDIPVFAACADLVFVSKAEVRDWPVIGRAAAAVGTIFIDRAARREIPEVNAGIRSALGRGDRVLFFPEGTSTDGTGVLPFKSSLLEPAAESGYPVFCAAVHYTTPPGESPASQSVCWWGDARFAPHVFRLARVSRIRARVVFHPEPHQGAGRKVLAERTEQVVRALHERLSSS